MPRRAKERVRGTVRRMRELIDGERPDVALLARIHSHRAELHALLDECSNQWVAEDLIYRFWHQSFKVYGLQAYTEKIARALEALCGEEMKLHPWFLEIIGSGTGLTFEMSHNNDWVGNVKPIVDAFFHAKYVLEMVVKYGAELEEAPSLLPSGWAAVLELFQIR